MMPGATILHVIDRGACNRDPLALADADVADLVRAAAWSLPQYRHAALELGTRTGTRPMEGVTVSRVRAAPGVLGAAVALRQAPRVSDGRCVLHCTSRRAAFGARLAFGSRWPILLSQGAVSTVEHADEFARRSRPRIASPDRVIVHSIEGAVRSDPRERGARALPLGSPRALLNEAERAAVREAMGIAPDACVVAAMSELRGATNARWLVFFAGILVAGGLDLTVLVPRSVRQVARMRRFHATTRLKLRVIIAEAGDDLVHGACDVGIVRAEPHTPVPSPGRLAGAIRRSHALGVPVIVASDIAPEGLYPGALAEHVAVPSATTRRLAKALTGLIVEPSLRESLRAEARAAAATTADDARLAAGLDEVYRSLLSGAVGRGRRHVVGAGRA